MRKTVEFLVQLWFPRFSHRCRNTRNTDDAQCFSETVRLGKQSNYFVVGMGNARLSFQGHGHFHPPSVCLNKCFRQAHIAEIISHPIDGSSCRYGSDVCCQYIAQVARGPVRATKVNLERNLGLHLDYQV